MSTASAIIIGDEILSGRVQDINTPYLSRRLYEKGVDLKIVVTIPDCEDTIAEYMKKFHRDYDYTFTSGGLGLTHDDMTLRAVAKAFNDTLSVNDRLLRFLSSLSNKPRKTLESYCILPSSAEIFIDEEQKSYFVKMDNIYVLPGIPELFRKKYELIHPLLKGSPKKSITIYLSLWEEEILYDLSELVEKFRDIKVGSYPVWDSHEYRVYIVLEASETSRLKDAKEWFVKKVGKEHVVKIENRFGVMDG